MRESSPRDDANQSAPSWWPIGLVVLLILITPLTLASLASTGPFREGDTIFSQGQQQVVLGAQEPSAPISQDTTCLLDPDAPLIIVQRPGDRQDGTILALVQGNPATEWPFCRPQAEVVLKPHQVVQKPDLLGEIRKRLARLMGS